MNLLAEEQKKLFEPGISDDERQKRQEMFLELYYRVREKHEAGILAGLSMKTRKRIHGLAVAAIIIKKPSHWFFL